MFHVEHQRRFFFTALRSTIPGCKADLARCQLKTWLKRLYSGSPHSVPKRLSIRSFALRLPSWLPVPFTRSLWMRSSSSDFGSPAFHFRTMQREVSKLPSWHLEYHRVSVRGHWPSLTLKYLFLCVSGYQFPVYGLTRGSHSSIPWNAVFIADDP